MRHGRKGCGRTDKDKLRGASRRQHKRQRRGECVRIRPGLCLSVSVSVLLVVAKKFGRKRVFAASSSCITPPTASYNVRLNLTDTTSQACSGQTTCCCGSAGRKGCRQSEAAVKRSDLANFDPDTPLEKLGWARGEMQRNFQQPMSARTMRVCTVCSERWDTAEDGGDGYRWVVCGNNKKKHTCRGHHLPWRKKKRINKKKGRK